MCDLDKIFHNEPHPHRIIRRLYREKIKHKLKDYVDSEQNQVLLEFPTNPPPNDQTVPLTLDQLPLPSKETETCCRIPKEDGSHPGLFPNIRDDKTHYYKITGLGYKLYAHDVVLALKRYKEAKAIHGSHPPKESWVWLNEYEECFHRCHNGTIGCLNKDHLRLTTTREKRKASQHHCCA
eukprot:CAMPEP_0172472038 /NCGR_PEP_ID=MMETSP1065-20121228/68124_1 /TAXON_ID=265537 /ORGANISM="Amphiprora paludosa, Strain CCMP125" /LENGTH=179 /DNA_ID=CAMNT_0013230153 /DNA_START=108 /DNA_END=647 /DNA_ORIENTATION=+